MIVRLGRGGDLCAGGAGGGRGEGDAVGRGDVQPSQLSVPGQHIKHLPRIRNKEVLG